MHYLCQDQGKLQKDVKGIMWEKERAKYYIVEEEFLRRILSMLDRRSFLTVRKRRGFLTMGILQWFLMMKRNSSNNSRRGLNNKDEDAPAQ